MLYYISKFIFLILLKIDFRKNILQDFKDLNFKQNDFINYKIIKYYVLKNNFVLNASISDIHTFNFLFYFQKLGGKRGIDLSKKNIFLWFKKFKYYNNFPWCEDLSSKRLINILYNYDFICSISNNKEIKLLNNIIKHHIKRIQFEFKKKKIEDISSTEVVAIVLIKCINNNLNIGAINKINEIINVQIDGHSMHKSYNILEHARFLNNLNEIKNIFLFFKINIPKVLNNNILAMTSLLSKYRHDDLSLPLFNGCNNNHNKEIENIIIKEQFLKNKTFKNFENGIAVYKDSQKSIFFDVVQPTKLGFNKELSAGSLAIEISANGEKIVTNCGGAESRGKNPAYLKYSAAHSTIILNNTNITEIKEGGVNKTFPKRVFFENKDLENTIIMTGTHNGYVKNYKKVCKRELLVDKKKNIIKGEDTIISTKSNIDKNVYHIRFHLMPGISTIVTENKKNIIIKTKKNNIWMFKSNNEILVEKSIFVKKDLAVETSQIVISGITSSLKNKVQWSLEKI